MSVFIGANKKLLTDVYNLNHLSYIHTRYEKSTTFAKGITSVLPEKGVLK